MYTLLCKHDIRDCLPKGICAHCFCTVPGVKCIYSTLYHIHRQNSPGKRSRGGGDGLAAAGAAAGDAAFHAMMAASAAAAATSTTPGGQTAANTGKT
jgi:hypothetical protein